MIFVLLAINIISIIACVYIAKRRQASLRYWALVGALLGPIALPFVLFAKPKQNIE